MIPNSSPAKPYLKKWTRFILCCIHFILLPKSAAASSHLMLPAEAALLPAAIALILG